MQLKVFTPIGSVIDMPVKKIDFEGLDGFWTLLPKHVDMVNTLAAGIVSYMDDQDKMHYVACNKGVLVKKDKDIRISTPLAILDDNLERLTQTIAVDFKKMEEERKEISSTMAKLEIGLIKGLQSLKINGGFNDRL